ncbi:MAG TPA: cytochrome c-type biogenesis protein [Pyrinomonadaceae bacterium]|jgi:cytochrome c-type biogenesis protein CcmH|nr:cytochrome c-type biogenesis protein [Pyrinomonadaceae bacterium]
MQTVSLRAVAIAFRSPYNTLNTKRFFLSLLLLASLPGFFFAKEATPTSADPVLEERVMKLSKELRCLVCQNETLADSRADLAVDLRNQVREQMKAGKSDKEIVAYLTARYGKFILYNPPIEPTTYLLWFGPFVLMLAGMVVLFRYVKQRRELIVEQPLSADDRLRAEALLKTVRDKETA